MAFVQGTGSSSASGDASHGTAYGSNVTAGDLLIAIGLCGGGAAGAPTFSVSDTLGNTWTPVGAVKTFGDPRNYFGQIWTAISIASGPNTVTVTPSVTTGRFTEVNVFEFGSIAVGSTVLVDQELTAQTGTTGDPTTIPALAFTTTSNIFACVSLTFAGVTSNTVTAPFTKVASGSQQNVVGAYVVNGGPATFTGQFAGSTTVSTISFGVGLKISVPPPASTTSFNTWRPQGLLFGSVTGGNALGNATVIYDSNPQILAGPNVFKCWIGHTAGGTAGAIDYYESPTGLAGSWTPYASNPVVAAGGGDSQLLPTVYKVGSTYYMYTGWNATGITVRTSSDGLTWASQGVQITRGTGTDWDATRINQLNLCGLVAGTWYAYYSGANSGNTPPSAIGLATSTDLIHWTKAPGNPKFTAVNTTYGMGQATFFQVGGTYYCIASKEPDITATNAQLDAGGYVALYLYSAPSPSGPWTQSLYQGTEWPFLYPAIPADFSTLTANVQDASKFSQIGDPAFARNCVTDSNGMDISVLSNVYLYFTISHNFGDETGTNLDVALSTTPAQLVASILGVHNAPVSGRPSFNLITSASDPGTGANANPIGGNWTPLSTVGTFAASQRASNLIEPSAINKNTDSWYAGVWPRDQYSRVTVHTDTASFVGPDVLMDIGGTQTAIRSFWNGTLGGTGTWTLQRDVDANSGSLCTVTNLPLNVGDTLMLVVIGTIVEMYYNDYYIYAFDMTTTFPYAGSPGFLLNAASAVTNAQISEWDAGSSFQNAPILPSGSGGGGGGLGGGSLDFKYRF